MRISLLSAFLISCTPALRYPCAGMYGIKIGNPQVEVFYYRTAEIRNDVIVASAAANGPPMVPIDPPMACGN